MVQADSVEEDREGREPKPSDAVSALTRPTPTNFSLSLGQVPFSWTVAFYSEPEKLVRALWALMRVKQKGA